MCGIFGIIDRHNKVDPEILEQGCDIIEHRGPDDSGYYINQNIGLGHRRLSILDLTSSGHQPMFSQDGKYVIIYNGEIYNHNELREQYLQKINFRSTSDTETLLEGYAAYGESFINHLNGIFSLAIFNIETKHIFIARDQLGVKPLYYYNDENYFLFGSEIKSFKSVPGLELSPDSEAFFEYLIFLWTPGKKTPFRQVKKLLPGHSLSFQINSHADYVKPKAYYKLPIGNKAEFRSEKEAIDILEQKLLKAVERQMLSDVPVGFFLSGGLDSSLLVAMAKKLRPDENLQTFTIRTDMDEKGEGFVNDLYYAEKVAKALDVKLEIVDADVDIIRDFDKMIWHLDEPQADPAPLNVLNICKRAKQMGYKVMIGGTGGDDLFSGYRRHRALKLEKYIRFMPHFLLRLIQNMLSSAPSNNVKIRRIKKLVENLDSSPANRIIGYFHWLPVKVVQSLFNKKDMQAYNPNGFMEKVFDESGITEDYLDRLLYLEQKSFLVDHNLNYTDKMSMAVGVEARVPFLDLELVEFAASLPVSLKLRKGETKYLLKKVAERYLPRDVIYRPKTGFGAPVRKWITRDLDDRIQETFQSNTQNQLSEIFNLEHIRKLIKDNKEGKVDASYTIWALLSIQSWMKQFSKK
jgi:asparagine synthase (glutamine-hydrolysing)